MEAWWKWQWVLFGDPIELCDSKIIWFIKSGESRWWCNDCIIPQLAYWYIALLKPTRSSWMIKNHRYIYSGVRVYVYARVRVSVREGGWRKHGAAMHSLHSSINHTCLNDYFPNLHRANNMWFVQSTYLYRSANKRIKCYKNSNIWILDFLMFKVYTLIEKSGVIKSILSEMVIL